MPVRDVSKEQLLQAGVRLLTSGAVVGVQKLLTPEALQEGSRRDHGNGVSRHTAYRLWDNRGEAVADIARHAVQQSASHAWSSFVDELTRKIDALWAAELAVEKLREDEIRNGAWAADAADRWAPELVHARLREAYRELTRDSVRRDLGSDEVAAGWALHCAAISSSFPWTGAPPSDGLAGVGLDILEARARSFEAASAVWADALGPLLAWWGRTLREGHDIGVLVRLMSGMHDGLVLQLFADPVFFDSGRSDDDRHRVVAERIDLVCDALFELVWHHTEQGRHDPRRAGLDPRAARRFDAIVESAMDLYWFAPHAIVGTTTAAYRAKVDFDHARAVFPSAGDLAESVLRRLVAPAGIDLRLSRRVNPAPLVDLLLRRLHRVVTRHPGLLRAVRHFPPTPVDGAPTILDELQVAVAEALSADTVVCPKPERTARLLLQLTLDAESDWDDVGSVLALLADP